MAGKPIVIIGEAYDPTLTIVGGPMPPGAGAPPDLGIWPSPGHPAHPIAPGGQPPAVWPGPGAPTHPIAPGGGPSQGPGFPTHPIVLPPGFIDGVKPEHPIVIPPPTVPGIPTHPIVIPPGIWPPDARPEHPIVIPPPPVVYPPRPTHPIVVPPTEPPQVMDNWDVVAYWSEEAGWTLAIIPSESHPGAPTPAT